ncbi:hypothetical protein C0V75_21300 [Tabrizicola sp. TH137]|uniref:hypothetical protein n=1 Tax=Tabrizicola sp. TH137 TaxID=2067452 RepID=UPI000C7AAD9C|nr:hypothetical protein [Tabrizicola sp. TH137]PLL10306.1 hypothetical protein C0V75_21300 [Tabrizicola sp. TH137]
MQKLILALGLSALLPTFSMAATVFEASATSTFGVTSADPGLTFAYSGTLDLGVNAFGSFGGFASANPSGASIPFVPEDFDPTASLTFGLSVNGATGTNPDLDSGASAFYERTATFTISNTSESRLGATVSIFYDLFTEVTSDGLLGELPFSQATFSILGDAVANATIILTKGLPLTVAGTETGSLSQSLDTSLFLESGQSRTLTLKLRAEGNTAASAVAPVPIPATAPLLAAALLGAGMLLRRRRAA